MIPAFLFKTNEFLKNHRLIVIGQKEIKLNECAYHPGVQAHVKCLRCKRPICDADRRLPPSEINLGPSERKKHLGEVLSFCPLCVTTEQAEESSAGLYLVSIEGIAYLVILVIYLFTGKVVVFGSVLVLVIMGIITTLLFAIALLGGENEAKKDREDMIEFLKTLKWKTPGNANVTVNQLLELPPSKMKKRIEEICYELSFLPNTKKLKECAILKKTLESSQWTLNNMGVVFSYFKKNIEFWSWRADLSEANKNRVAYAFTYLIAVRHLGKKQAYDIVQKAPSGFVQANMLPQLLEEY